MIVSTRGLRITSFLANTEPSRISFLRRRHVSHPFGQDDAAPVLAIFACPHDWSPFFPSDPQGRATSADPPPRTQARCPIECALEFLCVPSHQPGLRSRRSFVLLSRPLCKPTASTSHSLPLLRSDGANPQSVQAYTSFHVPGPSLVQSLSTPLAQFKHGTPPKNSGRFWTVTSQASGCEKSRSCARARPT